MIPYLTIVHMERAWVPTVQPELCVVGLDAADAETALRALASHAQAAGFVDATYAEALVARERAYPTGLPTVVPVALPHADPDAVLRGGIGVATFSAPIAFGEMGGSGGTVHARAAILLVLEESHDRTDLLSRLIDVVQRDDWHDVLALASTPEELATSLTTLLDAT